MANKTVSLRSVVKHFESLPDRRHERNRKHLLVDVISIAIWGIIGGKLGTVTYGKLGTVTYYDAAKTVTVPICQHSSYGVESIGT